MQLKSIVPNQTVIGTFEDNFEDTTYTAKFNRDDICEFVNNPSLTDEQVQRVATILTANIEWGPTGPIHMDLTSGIGDSVFNDLKERLEDAGLGVFFYSVYFWGMNDMSNTFHRSDSISLTSFCGAGILVDTEKSLRCLQITVEQNPHAGQNDGSTKTFN